MKSSGTTRGRIAVMIIAVMIILTPAISHAGSTSENELQMNTPLRQIVTVQKQLVDILTNEVMQLESQLSHIQMPLSRSAVQESAPMSPSMSVQMDAGFTASPVAGFAPLSVQFTVGEPGRFSLDFGDGQSISVNTITSQPWVGHTYASAGIFIATLTKTTDGSQVGSVTVSVR